MKKKLLVGLMLIAGSVLVTGCASWNRFKKNVSSDVSNGLERKVTIYNADGEAVKEYEGKFDVDVENNRIMFDDEKGARHQIFVGSGFVTVDEN